MELFIKLKLETKGYGNSHTPFYLERYLHSSPLEYRPQIKIFKRVKNHGETESEKLGISWYYSISAGVVHLYQFHADLIYSILEDDKLFNEEDGIEIIKQTHKYFQTSFDEYRKEFRFFSAIEDISDEETQKIVTLLLEVLSSESQS